MLPTTRRMMRSVTVWLFSRTTQRIFWRMCPSVVLIFSVNAAFLYLPQQPTVDVTAFGAKGDGVSDNADAINAAQASLPTGGTLYFPPGTYALRSQAVVLRQSNLVFRGAGMYKSLLKRISGEGSLIYSRPQYPVETISFEDLGFDNNPDETSGSILQVSGDAVTGIFRVSRCQFWQPVQPAVLLTDMRDVIIEDSIFHSPGTASGTGIQLNYSSQDIIIRRNRFLWLKESIVVNSDDENVIYSASGYRITDNYFDGGWWLIKSLFSGGGDSVSYTGTGLSDTGADFSGLHTYPTDVGHNIRVMPIRQTGSGMYTASTLTDPGARFVTNGLLSGEIIRTGEAFAVVAEVLSETTIRVEEWLSSSDYLPRSPPALGTSYTAYGIILGAIWNPGSNALPYTSTDLTTPYWWDLQGRRVTPASGTRYEVLVDRPNYTGIHAEAGFHDNLIQNNVIRRGWSDQISIFGGPNNRVIDNWIEDGQDMGITVNAFGNLVQNNTIRHQGAGGIWASGFDSSGAKSTNDSFHIIRNNWVTDSQWVNLRSDLIGDIIVAGNKTQVLENWCEHTGSSLGSFGIVVRNSSDNNIAHNICLNHTRADIYLIGASRTVLCNNQGVVMEQNTSGTLYSFACPHFP
jgi:hypothetical protein